MKRLLSISFDSLLASFLPILSWLLLGLILDKNLINVFTLTYPVQFIYYILKSIFGVSANIMKEKEDNENAPMVGLVLGAIVGLLIFGGFILNVDSYINFMNMDVSVYKEFAIYSFIQIYFQLILILIQNKLYYENRYEEASKYAIIFNLIYFILLITSSLIFKNKVLIILITLIPLTLYTIYMFYKNCNKFKFNINIISLIKYDSVEVVNNIFFFIIFLFGLSNVMNFDEKYISALTFVALITDTQWDIYDSISVVSKIDISKEEFNYKHNLKEAYKLLIIILLSVFILFICLFRFYDLNLLITLTFLSFEIVNFILYPIYTIKTNYIHLEYSILKTTGNKFISSSSRLLISCLNTPYSTASGQLFSTLYQYITINYAFHKHYKINKCGTIRKKKSV